LAGISSERTKFLHVISQLDQRHATEVEDIITSPSERDPYTTLRTELVKQSSPSTEQRIRKLLTVEEIGDRKPSQFLRYLRSLAPDVSENVLRSVWTSRLPHNVQSFLAGQNETNLDAAALCADRVSEVGVQPALASVDQTPDNATLTQEVAELSCQVAALGAGQDRLHAIFKELSHNPRDRGPTRQVSRPAFENRRPSSRSPRGDQAPTICWYHRRYGARALKCTQPCAYRQQRTTTQQTSPAAHVCATSAGRLFITDRITKRQFLVDTGSDLCVYPRRLIPRRRERVNYDLCAANGITIHTYGWLPLSLNLGLRRDFTWRFVVADVTHPHHRCGLPFPLRPTGGLPK
jgi:hypothetical protein